MVGVDAAQSDAKTPTIAPRKQGGLGGIIPPKKKRKKQKEKEKKRSIEYGSDACSEAFAGSHR